MSIAARPRHAARRASGNVLGVRVPSECHGAVVHGAGLVLGLLALVGCAQWDERPLDPAAELARLEGLRLDEIAIVFARAEPLVARPSPERDADPRDAGSPEDAPAAPARFDATDGLDEIELAALALTIHPDLLARRAQLGEARALLVSAEVLPDPVLGVFARPGLDGVPGTALGLDLLVSLLRPDERPARRALAEAELERTRAEVRQAEVDLVADVRDARLVLLAAADDLALMRQELVLRDGVLALVTRQRELGEAAELAVALVDLERAEALREVARAEASLARARSALRACVGLPPGVEFVLAGEEDGLPPVVRAAPDDEELDARLLLGHPGLAARAAAYLAADQALRLAAAGAAPSFALGPAFERDVDGGKSLGLGVEVGLPILDGNRGAIAEGEAVRESARAEYVAALARARTRAVIARDEVLRTRAEVELLERHVLPAVRRAESLVEAALRSGETTSLSWAAARTRAVAARRELVDALLRHAQAAVELDRATGTPLVALVIEDEVRSTEHD